MSDPEYATPGCCERDLLWAWLHALGGDPEEIDMHLDRFERALTGKPTPPRPVVMMNGTRIPTLHTVRADLNSLEGPLPPVAFTDSGSDDWHETEATIDGEPLYLCVAGAGEVLTRPQVEAAYGPTRPSA